MRTDYRRRKQSVCARKAPCLRQRRRTSSQKRFHAPDPRLQPAAAARERELLKSRSSLDSPPTLHWRYGRRSTPADRRLLSPLARRPSLGSRLRSRRLRDVAPASTAMLHSGQSHVFPATSLPAPMIGRPHAVWPEKATRLRAVSIHPTKMCVTDIRRFPKEQETRRRDFPTRFSPMNPFHPSDSATKGHLGAGGAEEFAPARNRNSQSHPASPEFGMRFGPQLSSADRQSESCHRLRSCQALPASLRHPELRQLAGRCQQWF